MKIPSFRHLLFPLAVSLLALAAAPCSWGTLYFLPTDVKPALPMEDAIDVCRTFMKKEEFRGYHIIHVAGYGSGEKDGAGSWTIAFRKGAEEKWLFLCISFPENICNIQMSTVDPDIRDQPERKETPLTKEEEALCAGWYSRDGKLLPPINGADPDPFAPAKEK